MERNNREAGGIEDDTALFDMVYTLLPRNSFLSAVFSIYVPNFNVCIPTHKCNACTHTQISASKEDGLVLINKPFSCAAKTNYVEGVVFHCPLQAHRTST